MTEIPQPEDIYRRTKAEGAPRLERPLLEVTSPLFNVLGGLVIFAWTFILGNFFLAAAGNMLGGVGLVTLNRLMQGKQGERKRASA